MDLPSYKQKPPLPPQPPPLPIPPVPVLPGKITVWNRIPWYNEMILVDPIIPTNPSNISAAHAKRQKIPAWLRAELGRIEKEKEKKLHNTSNNNHSTTESSSVNISSKSIFSFSTTGFPPFRNSMMMKTMKTMTMSATIAHCTNQRSNSVKMKIQMTKRMSPIPTWSLPHLLSLVEVALWVIVIGHLKKEQCVSYHLIFFSHFKDDDKATDPSLNLSAISKQMHAASPSPSPPPSSLTNTLIEDDEVDKEEQFVSDYSSILLNFTDHFWFNQMIKLRRALTELLLEVTNEELALIGKEVYLNCKGKSSRLYSICK